jgi:hypothetical protein
MKADGYGPRDAGTTAQSGLPPPGMTTSEVALLYRRSTAIMRLAKVKRSAITETK